MDGVISDTQKYHGAWELAILSKYGINTVSPDSNVPITIDWIQKNFSWVQPKERVKDIFYAHNKSDLFNIDMIEEEKNQYFLSTYPTANINFINWAKKLIYNLFDSNEVYLFVVTASTRWAMETVLWKLDIINLFDEIVSVYDIDVNTGKQYTKKSDPDVYNNLKNKYNIWDSFVMIEDGSAGMDGAIKAWWKAIAILSGNPISKFPQAVSHHEDLTSISLEEIKKILS